MHWLGLIRAGRSGTIAVTLAVALAVGKGAAETSPPGASTGAKPGSEAVDLGPMELSAEDRSRLEALGYLTATQPPPSGVGVVRRDPTREFTGSNLVLSLHAREALLVGMDGRILHRWRDERPGTGFPWWRTARLLPGGDLIAQVDYGPLARFDRDSRPLWTFEGTTHHDFEIAPDDTLYVLTQRQSRLAFVAGGRPVLEDFVTHLDARGEVLREVSLLRALRRGAQRDLLRQLTAYARRGTSHDGYADLTHTNSIRLLDGSQAARHPAFAAGNLLLSLPRIHALLILDFDEGKVVWSLQGNFRYQHDAKFLPNGQLLLFDNQGTPGRSAALELRPLTGAVAWAYRGEKGAAFYSKCCGRVHRLPNGNTLVIESEPGRALEVTREGDVVWEYVNPHRFTDDGDARIVMLGDVMRLDPDFPLDWIAESEP